MFEVIVDGESVIKTPNTKPTLFKNVKVWASQGIHYPVANALIRDLEHKIQKGKYEEWKTFPIDKAESKVQAQNP